MPQDVYFKAKMHNIRFPLGPHPRPHWGAYSAPPDVLAVFKGPTSKRREVKRGRGKGRKEEGGRKRNEKVRGGEGREREGPAPTKYFGLEPPLVAFWWYCSDARFFIPLVPDFSH